jgi:ComF family protein
METLTKNIKTLATDFISLLYPRQCLCCNQILTKQETTVCFDCLVGIPRTQFHLMEDNPVEMLFWGRIKVEHATSYFNFQKGSRYQPLLHALKYKGIHEVGTFLGRIFASEISESGFFNGIDRIVPVPLHPKKEKKRGYNQSIMIAKGMEQIVSVPVDSTTLSRNYYSETQTRKGRWERWKNVEELFVVNDKKLIENKHILLIDDVVTTGATLEACGTELLKCDGVKISIATLAWASV